MKKSSGRLVAIVFAFVLVGVCVSDVQAQGFHFGSGGVHLDVGYPHSYYGDYGGYYSRSHCYGGYPYTSYYGGGGGRSYWHDTTHLDYHPGYYARHRNHDHYVPGHYDVHEDGHWDHHD